MDKAKILRLLDEADDIVAALYRQGANKDYKCKLLREKLKAIAVEITSPPKTNADRIRQMTDEELAEMLDIYEVDEICCFCSCHGDQTCHNKCYNGIIDWLKQEASEDAGTD